MVEVSTNGGRLGPFRSDFEVRRVPLLGRFFFRASFEVELGGLWREEVDRDRVISSISLRSLRLIMLRLVWSVEMNRLFHN